MSSRCFSGDTITLHLKFSLFPNDEHNNPYKYNVKTGHVKLRAVLMQNDLFVVNTLLGFYELHWKFTEKLP